MPRSPLAAPAVEDAALPPTIRLVDPPRWAVQIFSSQSRGEVEQLREILRGRGVDAAVATADLGARGLWHRLLVGRFAREDLANLRGGMIAADPHVAPLLPPVAKGQAAYLLRELEAPDRLDPTLTRAVQALAPGREVEVALVRAGAAAPAQVLVAVRGDPLLRRVDAGGEVLAPLPPPRYPGCKACLNTAAMRRVHAVRVELVADLAGDHGDEVLVTHDYGEGSSVSSLWTLTGSPRELVELGGFVSGLGSANEAGLTQVELVDADGDPDVELLLSTYSVSLHEGDLCGVRRSAQVIDLTPKGLAVMDPEYFRALGQRAATDGSRFAAFAAVATSRGDVDLLLPAAVAYLAQRPALDDEAARRALMSLLDDLQRPDADLLRLEALALLATSQPEFHSALSPKLYQVLSRVVRAVRFKIDLRGCDEASLARAGKWRRSADDLARFLESARQRADLRRLPESVYLALASYPASSPIGRSLDRLVGQLSVVPQHHAAVKELVRRARAGSSAPE